MKTQERLNLPQWSFEAYLSDKQGPEFDFEEWLADELFNYWLKSRKPKTAEGKSDGK